MKNNFTISLSKAVRVFAPEVNERTSKWGVYAIPKLWREPSGELVVRFGGEEDDGFAELRVPNLYFSSSDNGESWSYVENGEERYEISVLTGINPPYLTRANGEIVALRYLEGRKDIPKDLTPIKSYKIANGANIEYVFRYGDIPDECKGLELVRIIGNKTEHLPVNFDFPEREVAIPGEALCDDGSYAAIPLKLRYNIFATSYISGLCELSDGILIGVCHGQRRDVFDRWNEEVYLVASHDGGVTWKYRSTIASSVDEYPFGFGGDGGELSLTVSENGNIICAMRMELSIADRHFCDTMLAVSSDNGFTFSKPFSVAESSVTPHVVALKGGIVVLIYGRPGVHFKVSLDNGLTWSEPYSLIGKTLSEERKNGVDDCFSKYYNTISYSNTFAEKLSEDTLIVIYNSLGSFEENGKEYHKAAYVRKITVKKACK